jgi:hypothetical protein
VTGEDGDADADANRVISVVDAVCCVHFCAAGKTADRQAGGGLPAIGAVSA